MAIRTWATAVLASLALALPAFAAETLEVVSEGPATQRRAVQLIVHSERAGRDFLVQVTAPGTPPILPGQTAPAIYVLDGGYDIAGPTGWLLGGAGTMAPAYVITIGYPPGGPFTRERDLLFGPGTRPDGTVAKGGGGAAFRAFLLEELKPFMEARYPLDPRSAVLFGHSLSGIFTANMLADHPEAFSGYLIASPSLWADPGVIDRLKTAAARALGRKVFVAWGAKEEPYMIDGGQKVSAALSGDPGRLTLKTKAFEDEQHISYYPLVMSAAFPFLLPRAAPIRRPSLITLTREQTQRYFGTYVLSDGRTVTIGEDEDGMLLEVEGAPPANIYAEALDRFYIHGVDARITFDAGAGTAWLVDALRQRRRSAGGAPVDRRRCALALAWEQTHKARGASPDPSRHLPAPGRDPARLARRHDVQRAAGVGP
jgi:predicted alpha/beta superfamily hydrolase